MYTIGTLVHRVSGFGIAWLAAILSAPANAGPLYNFTAFDGPGNNGGGATANAINNNGEVVGFSSDNAGNPTLFTNFIRHADGTFTTLGLSDPLAMANGINTIDGVVGGLSSGRAFTDLNGNVTTLPAVNNTTVSEVAFGTNDGGFGGLIVGQFVDGNTDTTPGFLYSPIGGFTILNPTVTAIVTNAQGVNNLGTVAGFYSSDGVHQHGFFYNATTQSFTFPADPNIANLVLTQFLGLNDNGLAVGYYQLPEGSQHGFLYSTTSRTYTFLDDPSAATSGQSITQITGINNADEITGFYVDSTTGLQRGFVATVAPEPGSFEFLFGGLITVLAYRRRASRACPRC
jgi:probable HAF family extracellular repeat protein